MRKIKEFIKKFFNLLVLKYKNRIYVKERLPYSKSNCDLLNYSASNMYAFLYQYVQKKQSRKLIFYIEYSNKDRLKKYQDYIKTIKNDSIKVVYLYKADNKKKVIPIKLLNIKNTIKKFSCKTWLCDSGDNFLNNGKLKSQNVICFNYFISCKNDLIIGQNFKWTYLKGLITTSLLAGQICSSALGVKLDCCRICGFPRNDTFFEKKNEEKVLNWIKSRVGYIPKNIILYAPTYRDVNMDMKESVLYYHQEDKKEEKEFNSFQGELLGYCADELSLFLEKSNSVFIYNLHHFEKGNITQENSRMIAYEDNYEFTLYDLMAMADCLISDYSSISYDFLLLDRPLIFNLYDMEKYIQMRGVSYDAFEEFCPGAIVKNWDEMKKALIDVVEGVDEYKEHRARVRKLLHKYSDGNSTDRVIAYFDEYLKNLLG